ncbi:hypothetical protein CEXT_641231 [Caerostris extrusa]|uniref:Uncharacterized protein n=1 Tax=Caerostris extrusa TaxID=172846 RepID=A0AAV4NQ89_CAEEX|nr:hypothetical protein CEXT_641231 [Caerostris extrusa]
MSVTDGNLYKGRESETCLFGLMARFVSADLHGFGIHVRNKHLLQFQSLHINSSLYGNESVLDALSIVYTRTREMPVTRAIYYKGRESENLSVWVDGDDSFQPICMDSGFMSLHINSSLYGNESVLDALSTVYTRTRAMPVTTAIYYQGRESETFLFGLMATIRFGRFACVRDSALEIAYYHQDTLNPRPEQAPFLQFQSLHINSSLYGNESVLDALSTVYTRTRAMPVTRSIYYQGRESETCLFGLMATIRFSRFAWIRDSPEQAPFYNFSLCVSIAHFTEMNQSWTLCPLFALERGRCQLRGQSITRAENRKLVCLG